MESLEIPTLETERLRLRPLRSSDLDDYAAMKADPEVMRYLGDGGEVWDRGRSWRHLAFLIGHWQLGGAGSWALELKETRTFLGVIGYSEPAGRAWSWPGPWPGAGGATAMPPKAPAPPWTRLSPSGKGSASSA